MNELLRQLSTLKASKKELGKELRTALLENSEFAGFDNEARAASEVLRSFKNKLIAETPALGSMMKRIQDKKNEIKNLKQIIKDGLIVSEKDTGAQIVMDLRF